MTDVRMRAYSITSKASNSQPMAAATNAFLASGDASRQKVVIGAWHQLLILRLNWI